VTESAGGASLAWAHRALGTTIWLRVRSATAGRLVLRSEDDQGEDIEVADLRVGPTDVDLDLVAVLGRPAHPNATYALTAVAADGTRHELLGAERATLGFDDIHAAVAGMAVTIRLAAHAGRPVQLTVSERRPWGELIDLRRDGGTLWVTGRCIGRGGTLHGATLVERDTDERLGAVVDLLDERFVVEVDLERITPGVDARNFNLILHGSAGDMRIGGHLDDVPNKGRAVVPDPLVVCADRHWWTVTPRFTDRNNLVITTSAVHEGTTPSDPLAGWEVDPADRETTEDAHPGRRPTTWRHRMTHRIARWTFDRLANRDRRTSAPPAAPDVEEPRHVHLLLATMHAMGGTIRATANTANGLAADPRNRVTLTAVYRLKEQQFVALDDSVERRVLVDVPKIESQTDGSLRTRLRAFALEIPSALIPRDDPRYYRFSLWHDLQLFRWLRSIKHGTIVTTRAGLSVVAARFANPAVRIVAQQHVGFRTQSAELQRDLLASYRAVDAVCVLTSDDENAVRSGLGASDTRVERLPNALDDLLPRRPSLTEPRILCGGRLTPIKGIDLMVEAFARIAEERPSWELRIYGSARADRLEAVREMVRRHGVADRVLLMAPTDRLEVEMAKASICAVPSRQEAFGMMIIEAMRSGLPVVAFDCPVGPREIITDGQDGLLVPAEDVEAFAERLLELTGDHALRSRLAAQGRVTAASYAPATVAAQLGALIDELHEQ
jgi:glycosyltransferase involved in cell wall biosynthesis